MDNLLNTYLSWFSFLKMNKEDYVRFENMTLYDFHHPILISIFYRSTAVLISINTIMIPLMIYVIQTQSKKAMGNYKNLLIIQLLIDYIFNIVTFIFHPILFWPILLGVSNGIFNLNTNWSLAFLYAEITLLIWMSIIQGYTLLYRFLAMFQNTFLHFIYRNDFIFGISLFSALSTGAAIPFVLVFISQIDPILTRQLTSEDIPIFKTLLEIYPDIIGFHPKLSNGNIYLIINVLAILFFTFPVIIIGFSVILTFRLKTLQKILSPQTFAMHKMLHKAMLVQIIIVTLSFLTPIAVLIIVLFLELKNGSMITPFCIFIVHMNLLLESLNLLYFIKPYRVFVFKNIFQNNIIGRKIVKVQRAINGSKSYRRRGTLF